MDARETRLKSYYEAHREACHRAFLKQLQSAGLKTYTAIPEAKLLPRIGHSMDLLIQSVVERTPELYVEMQRANFQERLAQGVDIEDLLHGMKAAEDTSDWLMNEVFADAPADLAIMSTRTRRYLLMTRTTLVGLLASAPSKPK